MANIVRSIGYSLGKVHAGMLAYLCDLYREGHTEPLESFFGKLGVTVPPNPTPRREWNSVDLAIFSGDARQPSILVEVKVDDWEHGGKAKGYQTVRYAEAWPDCDEHLFMTFGNGEYFRRPRHQEFTWMRLESLLAALNAIKHPDAAIQDWREEIAREVELREAVAQGLRERAQEFRAGGWNVCFLGQLAQHLEGPMREAGFDHDDLTCYTWGQRPDTILNFGWSRGIYYLEINYSGRLNLKVSLAKLAPEERSDLLEEARQRCEGAFLDPGPKIRWGGRLGKSKTIATFDVGLRNRGGLLGFGDSREETVRRIISVLSAFHGGWPDTREESGGSEG